MWRSESPLPLGPGSPACPDLLRHVGSPQSLPYRSFFEEECRTIVSLLLSAAAPSPGPADGSSLWPDPAGLVTSTPLHASPPLHERAADSARPAARPNTGAGEAVAPGPAPARGDPRALLPPAAGGCPGPVRPRSRLPRAPSCKAARRSTAQPPCGGPGPAGRPRTPARSPGRGGGRLTVSRARANLGLQLPKVGKGPSASGTRIPQSQGTKLMLAAKSSLQHPSGASQLAQPSAASKPAPRDTEMKTAGKVVGCRQPSQRFSARIPAVASRSRLPSLGKVPSPKRFCSGSRLIPGKGQEGAACARAQRKESEMQTSNGSTMQELICNTTQELIRNTSRELICNTTRELISNRTQELTENNESKEQLVAAGTLLEAGRVDQTWESVGPSFFSELVPGLTPGCGDAVAAEQSTGGQLSQELKCVRNELERVKGELADKTAQCEAYRQTISSLQAQLRAAGICPEGAAVEESGDSGRD
ncbi:transcription initiation factor TFIID subunit 4-like [Caloenas nicobarica]|uniref:transcription initiation factor TFIID subunit 4-like n=1 Tax=Caloenas nicobarica TaxID=187106 RepID=UPI0032B7AF9D